MRLDSAYADRVTAVVLFLLGASMSYGGFVMDRLEIRRIHPASFPGLVPLVLGVALMVCALALAWSAKSARAESGAAESISWTAIGFTVGWGALYALAAVGTLPFAPVTAVYVAGFTLYFLWNDEERGERPGATTLIAVAVFALGIGYGVAAMFRYGFLVRLP